MKSKIAVGDTVRIDKGGYCGHVGIVTCIYGRLRQVCVSYKRSEDEDNYDDEDYITVSISYVTKVSELDIVNKEIKDLFHKLKSALLKKRILTCPEVAEKELNRVLESIET